MFTGLIETVGTLKQLRQWGSGPAQKRLLTIWAPALAAQLSLGDSVCVAGICLTVVDCNRQSFNVEALGDTVTKTTVYRWRLGQKLNLERALALGDRLDGHMVQGHVNGTAAVLNWRRGNQYRFLTVAIARHLCNDVVAEGSIAIDGISLTVAGIGGQNGQEIRVSIIPHTYEMTSLSTLRPGDMVNIETDILIRGSKQSAKPGRSAPTMENLTAWGY